MEKVKWNKRKWKHYCKARLRVKIIINRIYHLFFSHGIREYLVLVVLILYVLYSQVIDFPGWRFLVLSHCSMSCFQYLNHEKYPETYKRSLIFVN